MQHNEALLEQKDVDSIHLLARDGWPVDEAEFARYTYDRRRGGWRALAYLIDKGLCTGVGDFFKRIFTPEHVLGFPEFPPISEVIAAIHAAGGAALCAHAASGFHGPGLERVLNILRTEKFDGFECYHSNHSEEGTQRRYAALGRPFAAGCKIIRKIFVKTRKTFDFFVGLCYDITIKYNKVNTDKKFRH